MDEERVILLFQNKRKEFLKKGKSALILFLSGFIGAVISHEALNNEYLPLFFMFFMFAGVYVFTFIGCKNYTCPKCNKSPMSWMAGRKGIEVDPLTCSNCGVTLKKVTQEEIDNSQKIWGFVALIIGVGLFFGSIYVGHVKNDIFKNGERVYGKVDKIYHYNRSSRYKIKWVDNASGDIVSQTTRSNDVFMYSAREGDTGEFILYANHIYPSSWTEFYVFPLIMFLISMGFFFSALQGFGIVKIKEENK